MKDFRDHLRDLPLIAILRGLAPNDARSVGGVLVEAGFRALEVPLNSPEPFASIGHLAEAFGERALVGAGTVLRAADVARVKDAGGTLVVMPHANLAVVREAKRLCLVCTPGVATPTEAFAALDAGADALKAFPAEALPPAVIKAWRAVLPEDVWLMPVGGITPERMAAYLDAGADGFGLGSALFKPEMPPGEVRARAEAFVCAWRARGGESTGESR